MARKRSTFSPEFKMHVVFEALQSKMTLQQLAQKHEISIKNIMNWKQQFFENASFAFQENQSKQTLAELKKENTKLEKELRQLSLEHEFVTRKVQELHL